ncbi:MAG: M23 family metallopeptidase [Bacilli bacterium]|nr:M23 family metallopeptidase [Bacilli bacterium]
MNIKSIKNFLNRILLSIIIFFFLCLIIDNNLINKDYILKNSIDFSYIRSKTRILFGNLINKKDMYVTSEKIIYKDITKHNNSYKLVVDNNYVIKSLSEGVVVFIGNIEGLGKTVTICSNDGVNISYSNIENISVNMYDYINKNTIVGSVIDNNLYLTFEKNKEYLSYDEYL